MTSTNLKWKTCIFSPSVGVTAIRNLKVVTSIYKFMYLYVCYSFLLISNKFCDLSLLHWALEANYDTALYNPLKSPMEAHVHKTTSYWYSPEHNAFDAGNSFPGLVFFGPKCHSHDGSMPFYRAQQPLSCPHNGFTCINVTGRINHIWL